jgi:hypothetical protein
MRLARHRRQSPVHRLHCELETSPSVLPVSPGPRGRRGLVTRMGVPGPIEATAGLGEQASSGSGRAALMGRSVRARRHRGARQPPPRPTPSARHTALGARAPQRDCGAPPSHGPSPPPANQASPSSPPGPNRSNPQPSPLAGTRPAQPAAPAAGRRGRGDPRRRPGPPRPGLGHGGCEGRRYRTRRLPPGSAPAPPASAIRRRPMRGPSTEPGHGSG